MVNKIKPKVRRFENGNSIAKLIFGFFILLGFVLMGLSIKYFDFNHKISSIIPFILGIVIVLAGINGIGVCGGLE